IVGLFVALNYRLKGLAPLLRSLPHVPTNRRFRIAIVGAQNYAGYEALARRLGVRDRVVFLGFRADPRDAYFATDFLVHATFYDPCWVVARGALGCSRPVVTSQYNGASEWLNPPADGLVVQDPHDARELGSKIADMLDSAKLPARKAAAREAGLHWTF